MALRHTIKKVLKARWKNNYEPYNRVELSAAALVHNFELFRKQNPDQSIIPVLKANAYGHGIQEIAEILNRVKLDFIAVDGYFEAATIAHITKHHILVMGAIKPRNVRLLNTRKCSFVVQDIATLRALAKTGRRVRVHMELNTGMQRLGLTTNEEIDEYLNFIKSHGTLKLEGVMSHLADADNPNNSFTDSQQKLFDKNIHHILNSGLHPKYIHLSQTAGSTKAKSLYANALRLGIGLYGINPLEPNDTQYHTLKELEPVMELKSTIIKVQHLKKGDKVSYNGIFTAPKPMRIGIIPLGYYEGYPRELSNNGIATYQSTPLPIVGRVCMNHIMIDLAHTDANIGSEVTLISKNPLEPNSIQRIRTDHNIFAYTLATGTNEHIRRVII